MNIPTVSANLLDQFARTLMTSLDGNRDGQLSTEEFTSYLAKLADTSVDTGHRTHATSHEGPAPFMAGFNDAKLGDPSHTTSKYTFGRVAQRYSLASVTDKASAEALLLQMRPELEAAGLTVLDVSKDRSRSRTTRATLSGSTSSVAQAPAIRPSNGTTSRLGAGSPDRRRVAARGSGRSPV